MRRKIKAYRAFTPGWALKDLWIEPLAVAVFLTVSLIFRPFEDATGMVAAMWVGIASFMLSMFRNSYSLSGIAAEGPATINLLRSSVRGGALVREMVIADLLETAAYALFETGGALLICELTEGAFLDIRMLPGILAVVFLQYSAAIAGHMCYRRWNAQPGRLLAVFFPIVYVSIAVEATLILLPFFGILPKFAENGLTPEIQAVVYLTALCVTAVLAVTVSIMAIRQIDRGYSRGFADLQN